MDDEFPLVPKLCLGMPVSLRLCLAAEKAEPVRQRHSQAEPGNEAECMEKVEPVATPPKPQLKKSTRRLRRSNCVDKFADSTAALFARPEWLMLFN